MTNKRIRKALKFFGAPAEKINAIHDDDLNQFLNSIGALKDLKSGKAKCKFCKKAITYENLQTVFPDSGNISFVCNEENCMRRFLDYYGEHHDLGAIP